MKAVGIIAEFNPFHNGHRYLIREARRLTGADYVIILLSPDFVQRGDFAIADKYSRTLMALRGGADLVLELPVCCASASAEFFAAAGVRILSRLSIADSLCFGCEEGMADRLLPIASVLSEESPLFKETLQDSLKRGESFPAARESAILAALQTSGRPQFSDPQALHQILSGPNNILAIEYLRAIRRDQSPLTPVMAARSGASYHDAELPEESHFASATALRTRIQTLYPEFPDGLDHYMPEESVSILKKAVSMHSLPSQQTCDRLLHYSLLTCSDPAAFADVSDELSRRILKYLPEYRSREDFAALILSRNQTRARVQRALLHILLRIGKEEALLFRDDEQACFTRILGFNKGAAPLLHAVRKNASIPVISRMGAAKKQLNPKALPIFESNVRASDIYRLASGSPGGGEFSRAPLQI